MVVFVLLFLVSSIEKINGVKLRRFFIDGGIIVLRNIFDKYYFFVSLVVDFKVNYLILYNFLRKRVIC